MKEMEDPFTSQVVCSWWVKGFRLKLYGEAKIWELLAEAEATKAHTVRKTNLENEFN